MRRMVDFPQRAPTNATSSPGRTSSERPPTATVPSGVPLGYVVESDRSCGGSVHPMPPLVGWAAPRRTIPQPVVLLGVSTAAPGRFLARGALETPGPSRYRRWWRPRSASRWRCSRTGCGSSIPTSALGVLYTIPSLGLFALLGPILGLGSTTVLIGLVLYALLIIVRNALTGLRQVPATCATRRPAWGTAGSGCCADRTAAGAAATILA